MTDQERIAILLDACKFALSELEEMTTADFQLGSDKALRHRLEKAIRDTESTD